MNRLIFIQRQLYRAKKRYGVPITLYNLLTSGVDRETGVSGRTLEKCSVKQALVLDSRAWVQFEYDLSWIMAARPFSMGGHFDTSERRVIVDMKDLGDFRIKGQGDESYMVFDDKKYQIAELEEFEQRQALVLRVKHVANETTFNQIFDENVFDFSTVEEVINES